MTNELAINKGYHTNVLTPPRFYLWKSVILECIQIPQMGYIYCTVIIAMQTGYASNFHVYIADADRCCNNAWFTLRTKFTFKGKSPPTICALLVNALQPSR